MMNSKKTVQNAYFELEKQRCVLATHKDFSALVKTYTHRHLLKNGNTSEFWDMKFVDARKHHFTKNYMQIDRNKTAASWFKHRIQKKGTSLNIGCGDGKFEELISKETVVFTHTGMDIATKSIQRLKNKYKNFNFMVADILKSSLLSQKFNIVCLFEVLEHISTHDTFKVLGNIYSLLQQDGYLLVSVPMNEGLEEMYPYNPNQHMRSYSQDLIVAELEIAGFKVIKFKLLYAFSSHYRLKTFLATYILRSHWKPNNILILARKIR